MFVLTVHIWVLKIFARVYRRQNLVTKYLYLGYVLNHSLLCTLEAKCSN
jgi:hypothetical protein